MCINISNGVSSVVCMREHGLNQSCQEGFWGLGQGFEMRPYIGITYVNFFSMEFYV